MKDYAPRLMAQQQQAADQAAIDQLESMAAPLMMAIRTAAIALCLYGIYVASASHVEQYLELAANQEAFVQCMNGHALSLGGDAVLHCEVHQYQLIAGVRP